ncbi:MAG TPA: preprotein translocase subunit SecE [Longimicrobiales bacterium]|nr:preprotein translocase subunit SecE [Longimicrobiales bacterium]
MAVSKIEETKVFLEESIEELRKVTWPDQEQLRSATIVVLVFLGIVSAMIWSMDTVVRWVLDIVMGIFGA